MRTGFLAFLTALALTVAVTGSAVFAQSTTPTPTTTNQTPSAAPATGTGGAQ